jgi:hypothetical protein
VAKELLLNVAFLLCLPLVLVTVIYYANSYFLIDPENGAQRFRILPVDALFLEGILSIVLGILFLLGSGGLGIGSKAAATLAAATDAITGKETIGPAELYRRSKWKPQGYLRFALVLIMTGLFLLIFYFVSVYVIH